MAQIQPMKDFTFKHSDQPDALYRIMDAAAIKKAFDSRSVELRVYLNNLINLLNTDGANNIAMLPIKDLPVEEATIQKVIEALHLKLVNTSATLDDKKANKADVYTKDELIPWLRGGDTNIKEEVFKILTSNNGDGTFYYTADGINTITGIVLENGEQVFNLREGYYEPGLNRLEVFIGDTLRRTVKSGGIIEIDNYSFALTQPEGEGAEITVKYYERIGMTAEYNIKMSTTKPPANNGKTMWFKVIG